MALATPTASSAIAPFAQLAAEANVGPDLLDYLKARSLDRTATLALVASDEAEYIRAIVEPFINGVTINAKSHNLEVS